MISPRFAALQWFAVLLMALGFFYALAPILSPFLAAAILAYICHPLVEGLSGRYLSRTLATLMVMAALIGIFVLLILMLLPLLRSEIELLLVRFPDLLEALRLKLFPLWQQAGQGAQGDVSSWKFLLKDHLKEAGNVANRLLPWLTDGGAALLAILMNILLIPLAMFYLLRDWPQLLVRIDALIPRRWHDATLAISREIDDVLAQFMRGQLSVMLMMSVFYVLGISLIGVQFALPIGIVSGLLVFIPYIGVMIGVALATLVAFTQFGQWNEILFVWLVFGLGQILEGMIITPKLVGERIGLHPLAVVFALLACGQLFGFFGILLALPMAAMLLVGLRHLKAGYLGSELYQRLP